MKNLNPLIIIGKFPALPAVIEYRVD